MRPQTKNRILTILQISIITGIAGLCGVLAISYPAWWLLAPVSLGIAVFQVWSARSLLLALVYGLTFGLITASAGIWWFWDTLPLDWIGLSHGPNQTYFVFASFWPVALVLGLAVIPGTVALWLLRNHPLRTLALVPIWVLTEELRMWNFSFLTYADRSLLGPHFSTASLGYPLAENGYVLQLASFGGLAALNAGVAVGAGMIALLLARQWRSAAFTASCVLGIICLLLPLFAPSSRFTGTPLTITIVQTDIPVGWTTPTDESFVSILRQAKTQNPSADIIVIPEERLLEPAFVSEHQSRAFFKETFGTSTPLIIHSEHEPHGTGFQNALVYQDATGTRLGKYRKMFLMPGGEYMPYLMTAVFSFRPDSGLGKYMDRLPNERLAPSGLVAIPYKDHRIGGLICSDVLSPQLYRFLVREHGADVLVNSANPAWFHNSKILFDKTVQMAKTHAVANRTYYLQSSNGSPAFAIGPDGRVIAMTHGTGTQMISVTIGGK